MDASVHSTEELKRLEEQEKIEAVMRSSRPTVAVLGVGGAGCNIVSWMKEHGGVAGARLFAFNTDAAHLSISKADRRILIGERLTKGLGCGGYPDKGEKAARESLELVKNELDATNIIYVIAGLGGGTGTGASPVIAEALKSRENLAIGIVTLPFEVERARMEHAKEGIRRLRSVCDTVVVIDNNKLVKVAGNLPLKKALGVANELVGDFIKGIIETITTPSLINMDYADLKSITEKRGIAVVGVGEGQGEDRVEKAVKTALNSQLLDLSDVTKAHGALVYVKGGDDITLEEVTKAGDMISRSLPSEVKIVWGARVDEAMNGKMQVVVTLTGVESAFLSHARRPFIP